MEIISHRGYWHTLEEKNTTISFERSFALGFGTETDVRDYNGELVISHDIPDSTCMTLDGFFKLYQKFGNTDLTLALNIKSDGLQQKLKEKLIEYGIKKYFVFDMSIPDSLGYLNKDITTFVRQSEYEPVPFADKRVKGIWLDSFISLWYDVKVIKGHIESNNKVTIVSSELHKRVHHELWEFIKNNQLHKNENLVLCTDLPEEANNYFKD